MDWDSVSLTGGVRLEIDQSNTTQMDNQFFSTSLAMGGLYKLSKELFLGLNLSHNERAPNYQELYANGAHIATQTFEVGDTALLKEKSLGVEISLRKKSKSWSSAFTVFVQKFTNFINLSPTGSFDDTDESGTPGDSPDDFPIFNYSATEAEIYGAEWESTFEIDFKKAGHSQIKFTLDYLRGRDTKINVNLPRISPFRAHLDWSHKVWRFGGLIGLKYISEQSDLAPNETYTPSYALMSLGISYAFPVASSSWTVFTHINNVFDVEARNHVSLIKDRMQLGGRDYMFGLRGYF